MNDRFCPSPNFSIIRKSLAALLPCLTVLLVAGAVNARAAELLVGVATTDITPKLPVAQIGSFSLRVAKKVESPITASVLVLESREGEKVLDQTVMVACDICVIRGGLEEMVRQRVKSRIAGLDVKKLFLSATHTHTAPVTSEINYAVPKDMLQPAGYREFFSDRVTDAVVKAWEGRKPGGVSFGLGHAVVANNRRAVYAGGSAQMYAQTNRPDFRGIEGYEDHGVGVLFFWDDQERLIAMAIDVACPAQEVEGHIGINADFWHETRQLVRKKYGKDLCVLGWCGVGGDQSPHLMYNRAAEERMRKLRGLTRLEEIARRIGRAVDEVHEVAKNDIRTELPLIHKAEQIEIPRRIVTAKECAAAKAKAEKYSKDDRNRRRYVYYQEVVDRYASQKEQPNYQMELHVIRLGDVAICTNPFELFTDYGIRIQARSKAVQTFAIQLVGPGTYVPTARAVEGGGYGALVESSRVGPKGGQALVDKTVEAINSLWATPK